MTHDPTPGDPSRGSLTPRHPMAYHSPINFAQAAAHVIPFGRYAGQTVDQIAKTDRGLLWLQFIYDDRLDKLSGTTRTPGPWERETNGCLHVYLTNRPRPTL